MKVVYEELSSSYSQVLSNSFIKGVKHKATSKSIFLSTTQFWYVSKVHWLSSNLYLTVSNWWTKNASIISTDYQIETDSSWGTGILRRKFGIVGNLYKVWIQQWLDRPKRHIEDEWDGSLWAPNATNFIKFSLQLWTQSSINITVQEQVTSKHSLHSERRHLDIFTN